MSTEIKLILHAIKQESEEQIARLENTYSDKMREMIAQHYKRINDLETKKDIDEWLRQYRGVSFEEWVETL
jgi:hypothetical protein